MSADTLTIAGTIIGTPTALATLKIRLLKVLALIGHTAPAPEPSLRAPSPSV